MVPCSSPSTNKVFYGEIERKCLQNIAFGFAKGDDTARQESLQKLERYDTLMQDLEQEKCFDRTLTKEQAGRLSGLLTVYNMDCAEKLFKERSGTISTQTILDTLKYFKKTTPGTAYRCPNLDNTDAVNHKIKNFDRILQAKNADNKPLFCNEYLPFIFEYLDRVDDKLLNHLLDDKNKDGTPRFNDPDVISELITFYDRPKMKLTTDKVIEAKQADGSYRFDESTIKPIFDFCFHNYNRCLLINDLIALKSASSPQEALLTNDDVKKLCSKWQHKTFDAEKKAIKYSQAVRHLLTETTKETPERKPLFSVPECIDIADAIPSYAPELPYTLIDINKKDGSFPRFNTPKLFKQALSTDFPPNATLLTCLADIKKPDGTPAFDAFNILVNAKAITPGYFSTNKEDKINALKGKDQFSTYKLPLKEAIDAYKAATSIGNYIPETTKNTLTNFYTNAKIAKTLENHQLLTLFSMVNTSYHRLNHRVLDFITAKNVDSTPPYFNDHKLIGNLLDTFSNSNLPQLENVLTQLWNQRSNGQKIFTEAEEKSLLSHLKPANIEIFAKMLDLNTANPGHEVFTDPKMITFYLENFGNYDLKTLTPLLEKKNKDNTPFFTDYEIYIAHYLRDKPLPYDKIISKQGLKDLSYQEKLDLLLYVDRYDTYPKTFNLKSYSFPLFPDTKEALKNLNNELRADLLQSKDVIQKPFNISEKAQRAFADLKNSFKKASLNDNRVFTDIARRMGLSSFKSMETNGSIAYHHDKKETQLVKKALQELSYNDQTLVLSHFALILGEDDTLKGFCSPQSSHYAAVIQEADNKEATIKALNAISSAIKPSGLPPTLAKSLNTLFSTFPELESTIGRKQHDNHRYTLDIHTLRAVEEMVNDPEFVTLPPYEQEVATTAMVLHDISKQEGCVDPLHPEHSAYMAYKMLKSVGYDDAFAERVWGLINNHHWPENLNSSNINDYAVIFRRPNDFKIARLMQRSDLVANGFQHNYDKFIHKSDSLAANVETTLEKIHQNTQYIPLTEIPRASHPSLKPYIIDIGEGVDKTRNTVINFCTVKSSEDLHKLGFSDITTPENLLLMGHSIDNYNDHACFDFLKASKEGGNGVFSCSLYDMDCHKTFNNKPYGFLLNAEASNISLSYYMDFETPFGKSYDFFKDTMTSPSKYRTYLPNLLKNTLFEGTDDEKTQQYLDFITHNTSMDPDEKQKMDNDVVSLVKKSFLDKAKLADLRYHWNEVVAYAPKTQAIFTIRDPKDIPSEMRLYAEENDLPIVVF